MINIQSKISRLPEIDTKFLNDLSTPKFKSYTIYSEDNIKLQTIGYNPPANNINNNYKLIKNAFIASEDRRFRYHNGIDLISISRAILNNIFNQSSLEGASTITQQVARLVYLDQKLTYTRKIKEALLALELEKKLDKETIINIYLNNIYLGGGAYGITNASQIYFSKYPNELTLSEIALLASLAPAPSIYSPFINRELAIKQREKVLVKMLKEGFISPKQFMIANSSALELDTSTLDNSKSLYPFITSIIVKEVDHLYQQNNWDNQQLKIISSININWQSNAVEIINKNSPKDLNIALVSIESSTGLIKTLIGGNNFSETEFNLATQALRPTASTFKIFTYAAALKKGINIDDEFIDEPQCWSDNYCPKNFGNKYYGKISLLDSFKYSSNIISIKLIDLVGFEEVIETANKFGVGNINKINNYYSIGIGSSEETLLNMTNAFSTINNQGLSNKNYLITKIINEKDEIIWSHEKEQKPKQVISKEIANKLNLLLHKSVEEGTGKAAKINGFKVLGKTGTSDMNRDLWFIGSIQDNTHGIWMGYEDNRESELSSGDAARIWKLFTKSTLKNKIQNNN
tara:strand:+ start:3339 stop:5066 length:1728 start_codon:yes stop_codon:yes gene_type:complete